MNNNVSAPHLEGKTAAGLFILVLFSFVIESQLTQHVQSDLGYRQPFFLFYIVHSSFAIIFFFHIAYLVLCTKHTLQDYLDGLSVAIKLHLSPKTRSTSSSSFPWRRFSRLALLLTIGVTVPSLLWFCAVSLAPISDVTAIWNANAFFAYVITVKLFKLQWDRRRLFAVVLATLGVMAVIYGGSSTATTDESPANLMTRMKKFSSPLVGDLLTLMASVSYGLYQVLYKRHVTLPSDPEHEESPFYSQISASEESLSARSDVFESERTSNVVTHSVVYPPPFGLHPNLLTSLAGLLTFVLLWIPIPILHYTGIEPFRLPKDLTTTLVIGGIALSGVFFNAGFMILLGLWGPIVASIGNLLTIVLIFISDVVVDDGMEKVTVWNVMGASAIVAAFGVLAHDSLQRR